MSMRYKGGFITATAPTTSTAQSQPGVWTLEQQLQAVAAGTWPTVFPPAVSLNVTYQNSNQTSGGNIYTRNITQDGLYTIYVEGAAGRDQSGNNACAGRQVVVTCVLLNGQTIYMLPGTQGKPKGGGGGSFLLLGSGTSNPICGAGGGGGRDNSGACDSTTNGQPVTANGAGGTSNVRNLSNDGYTLGGVNGNGSTIFGSPARIGAGAGAGLYTNGLSGFFPGGTAYANGGSGGNDPSYGGGFGGAGSGDTSGGGAGGGYSGGGGVWDTSTGGGGGSWVVSTLNGYPVTYSDNGAIISGNGRIYIA